MNPLHTGARLPKSARRLLLGNEQVPPFASIYFDSNCVAPLLFNGDNSLEWANLRLALGVRPKPLRTISPFLTVLQFTEVLGIRPPNIIGDWQRPRTKKANDIYLEAMRFAEESFESLLGVEVIREKFLEVQSKIANNPFRELANAWIAGASNVSSTPRLEAFRSTLIEQWKFQFLQIAELYGDSIFRDLISSIFYSALMNRANGDDIPIYRAIQKDVRIFCRLAKKRTTTDEERAYFDRISKELPEFKDRGDDVDSELIHYAVVGSTRTGRGPVLAITKDPDVDKMKTRLTIARGHYDYIRNKTEENFPDFAASFHPGWVAMVNDKFELRSFINVGHDIQSWFHGHRTTRATANQ